MKVFIVASDEPMFLVPYLRAVIEACQPMIVGVGVHRPPRRRAGFQRTMSLAMLAAMMLSPRQWLQLLVWKCHDVLAGAGLGRTRHHLADVCREAGVPFREIASVNADAFIRFLQEEQVDVLFHQSPEILRSPILNAPRVAVLNRHMSMLPAYRGAWPLFWQLANGERQVGVTFHVVDEGIDSGAIVLQECVERLPRESTSALLKRLFERAVPMTRIAFERLTVGRPRAEAAAGGRVYKTPTASQILRYLLKRRPGSFAA